DYDNDGDLDIFTENCEIYKNDSGSYSKIDIGFYPYYPIGWGDFDNDNDIDLFGSDNNLYINNGSDIFTDSGQNFGLIAPTEIHFGDYDNDGDLDILHVEETSCSIYRNTSGSFTNINADLTDLGGASSDWGDINNDGLLDFVINRTDGIDSVKIVINNGDDTFEKRSSNIYKIDRGEVNWGDCDNDGDIDLIQTSYFYDGMMYPDPHSICYLYKNNNGSLSDRVYLRGYVSHSSVKFGDHDNDGDLDLLMSGTYWLSPPDSLGVAKIFENDGEGSYSEISTNLDDAAYAKVFWGDHDNDGDLDILQYGEVNGKFRTKLFLNNIIEGYDFRVNTKPFPPNNLASFIEDDKVFFTYDSGSDLETPTNGLTYNIQVDKIGSNLNIRSAMADIDGSRLVSYLGNACQSNSFFITLNDTALIQETLDIEFKVQSLDHIYAGSVFTAMSTISYTRDLLTFSNPVMFDTDTLIWELILPDTIDTFDIELDDDVNFASPLVDNISIKNKDEFFYYLEVQDFAQNDLMID
ncbi:MAG: VCBS repeat-containing protein, partial [Candidatus Delongbacteria bacterium]|nr:VCBS repeat-containing protein [Candidatus Delongbacteria bacterium]